MKLMMKQSLSKQCQGRGECPVECPICSHEGEPYPARFDRRILKIHETTNRMACKANIILFLIDGALDIHIDGRDVKILSRQAVFFSRNTHFNVCAAAESEILWLEFSNRIVLGVTDILSLSAAQASFRPEKTYPVLELKQPLLDRLRTMPLFDSPCYHLNLQYELYLLMKYCYDNQEVLHFFRPILLANDDFRAFVIDNYRYGDTLEDIARKANMSINHFLRRFKCEFGMTAHQWLVKQKALKLLQTIAVGQDGSKRLAEQFGFNSPAGLYIFCRRQFGKSLKQLMKEAAAERYNTPATAQNGEFCFKKGNFR